MPAPNPKKRKTSASSAAASATTSTGSLTVSSSVAISSSSSTKAKRSKPAAATTSTTNTSAKKPAPGGGGASTSWASLDPPLSPWLLSAITESMGFTKMTPVQASTIPLFMGNKDVVVEAVTGSGKTLAFLVPVVERILRGDGGGGVGVVGKSRKRGQVGAIIVSPTRELASQIYSVLLSLLSFHGPSAVNIPALCASLEDDMSVPDQYNPPSSDDPEPPPPPPPPPTTSDGPIITPLLLVGGTKTTPAQDLKAFLTHSPNILIGTPGRLNELLSSQHVHCSTSTFEALVLDEADRLLDLGFQDIIMRIIARLPKQRRTGLFSASISDAIVGSLIKTGLRNPVKVLVKVKGGPGTSFSSEDKRTPASLSIQYIIAPPSHRLAYVQQLLSPPTTSTPLLPCPPRKSIIYLSSCASVDYFTHLLPTILPPSRALLPLHGKLPSSTRTRNFTKFTSLTSPCTLLTTDLASRGLDIPLVDLIIQIDLPTDPKVFLHRCGRAGRAGRRGTAIFFLTQGREEEYIPFLHIRKTPVETFPLPPPSSSPEPSTIEHLSKTITTRFRTLLASDRSLHEKSLKAFVSHVRAYTKHQTSSIFRLGELPWQDLIEAFALLKVPRMPELRNVAGIPPIKLPEGLQGLDVNNLKYKDPVKEARRLEELSVTPAAASSTPATTITTTTTTTSSSSTPGKTHQQTHLPPHKRTQTTPWSTTLTNKSLKETRRERKRRRREEEKMSKLGAEERRKVEEWKELVEEVKRAKREERREDGVGKKGGKAGGLNAGVDLDMDGGEFMGFD